ncbi:MAG: RnfABCDGE type electron transport complex subunit G [Thermodesulfobacteriota bacterium]
MREMMKMVIVLTVLASLSGGLLAAVKNNTQERIDSQVLEFVKGPAILKILEGTSNDPIKDRFSLTVKDEERNFFVAKYDGKPKTVAFETKASGYGGDMGVMVAVNIQTGEISGVSVTTHNETPGIGARIETASDFKNQFEGLSITAGPKVKDDGGEINAMAGATVTSRAVTAAVRKAGDLYKTHESKIKDKAQSFAG